LIRFGAAGQEKPKLREERYLASAFVGELEATHREPAERVGMRRRKVEINTRSKISI
jgi:hypothetical protein